MTTNIVSLNPYQYGTYTGEVSGRLFVPVNPAAVIYAHFDHISGVAAPAGQNGVSLTKLQILNSLINGLSTLKNTPKVEVPENTSSFEMDALIDQYQAAVAASAETNPQFMLSGVESVTGGLVNISI